jgi:hypothetical protein
MSGLFTCYATDKMPVNGQNPPEAAPAPDAEDDSDDEQEGDGAPEAGAAGGGYI